MILNATFCPMPPTNLLRGIIPRLATLPGYDDAFDRVGLEQSLEYILVGGVRAGCSSRA